GVAGCALPTALQTLARAWEGEGMECGGKRSATLLWLSPGDRCGQTIVRSVIKNKNGRGCDNSLSYLIIECWKLNVEC
ncbi:MAG: hypothetical protein NTW21_35065, partial [Verrucomicrobia bacterium]|nr:hypothetical protein [Verrucomicrobiota bacterium]